VAVQSIVLFRRRHDLPPKKLEWWNRFVLYLMPAIIVASIVAHNALFIGEVIFNQIHTILSKRPEITSVTEAVTVIDYHRRSYPNKGQTKVKKGHEKVKKRPRDKQRWMM
jgi:hypothetical protein